MFKSEKSESWHVAMYMRQNACIMADKSVCVCSIVRVNLTIKVVFPKPVFLDHFTRKT